MKWRAMWMILDERVPEVVVNAFTKNELLVKIFRRCLLDIHCHSVIVGGPFLSGLEPRAMRGPGTKDICLNWRTGLVRKCFQPEQATAHSVPLPELRERKR